MPASKYGQAFCHGRACAGKPNEDKSGKSGPVGLIGSGAFREDHPEVLEGLQVGFNQDNGTWRFERIEGRDPVPVAHLTVRAKDGIYLRVVRR